MYYNEKAEFELLLVIGHWSDVRILKFKKIETSNILRWGNRITIFRIKPTFFQFIIFYFA